MDDPARPKLSWRTARGAVRVALVLVLVATIYALAPVRPMRGAGMAWVVLGLVAVVVVTVFEVRAVLASRHPVLRGVEALVVVLGLLLLVFASAYVRLSATDPSAFTQSLDRPGALYFAVTVLTTTGFGDIVGVTTTARMFVTVQMLVDLVYLAMVVRLITTAAQQVRNRGQAPD